VLSVTIDEYNNLETLQPLNKMDSTTINTEPIHYSWHE